MRKVPGAVQLGSPASPSCPSALDDAVGQSSVVVVVPFRAARQVSVSVKVSPEVKSRSRYKSVCR